MITALRTWCMIVLASCLVIFSSSVPVTALPVPPAPSTIPIVDTTNTLSLEQQNQLAALIADSRSNTGNQIAILMIPSLEDESLEEYSIKVAREWGIGVKDRDNGVLLFIAKDDRRLRIEVGYGLEGALTDIRSGQIIRDRISPEFKQGKYYEGIQSGIIGITTAIEGEIDPSLTTSQSDASSASVPWEMIFFGIFFIPMWLGSMLARTKSWWAGGVIGAIAGIIIGFIYGFLATGIISILLLTIVGLLFDRAVSANYQKHAQRGDSPSWWAGGPYIGGGGSSGGFGGFGGGGFGGGGASGDW